MNPSKLAALSLVSVSILVTGCMPKMTIAKLSAMRIERPAELDKLQAFVGKWKWEGELTVAGLDKPLSFTGNSEAGFEDNGGHLVSHEIGDIEGLGHTEGIGTWAYDVRARKFRTTWLDSMGSISSGTALYNDRTDTWLLRVTTRSPHATLQGRGHVKFSSPDTMDWDWSDYVLGGTLRVMQFKGTATRVN